MREISGSLLQFMLVATIAPINLNSFLASFIRFIYYLSITIKSVAGLCFFYLIYYYLSPFNRDMSHTARKKRKFPSISYKVCLRKCIYQGNTRSFFTRFSGFCMIFSQKNEINPNNTNKLLFLFYTILQREHFCTQNTKTFFSRTQYGLEIECETLWRVYQTK